MKKIASPGNLAVSDPPSDVIETYIWVRIGPVNALLPDSTKPLPEPLLPYHQKCSVAYTWEQFHKKSSWT